MILNLRSRGDSSVGILPWMVEVWIDGYEFDDDDDRADFREYFRGVFSTFLDDKFSQAWFEDECPECHGLLEDGECKNKDCKAYYEEPEVL